MDVIRLLYTELFTIKLVHTGFEATAGSKIFTQLLVEPDGQTKQLFKRLDVGYRCVSDTVVCFIRSSFALPPAKNPKVPFVTTGGYFFIRLLLFASPSFVYKTYVAPAGSKTIYYFNNQINNVQSGNRYLSRQLQNYNAAGSYDSGTVVSQGGVPFATLQPVNGAEGINIANNAYWKSLAANGQIVNNADLLNKSAVKPSQTCFGAIDIFTNGTTNATYSLFNNNSELQSPAYVIPFKSRA